MKASELMIGDWVIATNNGTVPLPSEVAEMCPRVGKVVGIDCDCVMLDFEDFGFMLDCIEPVPLTPDILEKNGFEFGYTASEEEFCSATGCGYPEEKGWCYDDGAGEIKIIFPTQSDGGLIRLDDQSFDRHLEIVYVKTIMVHELQHALRLCKIEKAIEL